MRSAGIICECNPLHAGHLYLLEKARASGAETVVAVMSGCFVQRGEAAIANPYARAEILVRSGFDAVVELPFPFSAASAEFFGGAGVEILSRLGVGEIWFGSECGDVDRLSRAAEVAESPAFLSRYAQAAQGSGGTARVYFDCLKEACGTDACSPNDILALSYLRAIRRTGCALVPMTVQRMGSGYSETVLKNGEFPSATALRRAWREKGLGEILPLLSDACAEVLAREEAEGRAPADTEHAAALVLGHFRLCEGAQLSRIADLEGGLYSRLQSAALRARSVEELCALAATGKYTDARLRRGLLFALTGVERADLRAPIAYVRLLAANRVGCAFLRESRKRGEICTVTRQTDLPKTQDAERQFQTETRARALYSLCLPRRESAERLLCSTPRIL